ncbi:MAG: AAA-like domain-containing protein [Methanomicrobiales archaeon]|nr:AAA-like domain-containing protein [Methanomicrobiales archaeon]
MRFFNTAGPVNCAKHYCLPPLQRLDLEEILNLIHQEKYFVLHAPRQTGKTSCLLALMEYLNREGIYSAVYLNVESAQAARESVSDAMHVIIGDLERRTAMYTGQTLPEKLLSSLWSVNGPFGVLAAALSEMSARIPRPLVLFIDEIDSLVGDSLISVLRQLRSGYDKRPANFPSSIVLCGVRDVRDYRIHSEREKSVITGGSAFNIKAKSLRLGNFSTEEVKQLCMQHTDETRQAFQKEALTQIWTLTCGQPWLVNALAYEVCFEMIEGKDRIRPITANMIEEAKERLIMRRETHLDQLADKLKEERVRRVIEPMLEGTLMDHEVPEDDISYLLDLGLISRGGEGLQIANLIYREVIPRQLTLTTQYNLESTVSRSFFIMSDGRLDL